MSDWNAFDKFQDESPPEKKPVLEVQKRTWTVSYEGITLELNDEDYKELRRLSYEDPVEAQALAIRLLERS